VTASHSLTLSRFLAATGQADIPEGIYRRAARVLADTAAVIAAGMAEPEMQALLPTMPRGGPATALGAGARFEAGTAAFLNGTAGTFLELDEGAAASKGHPGIHVIPPLLAWAEAETGDGERLLHALVLGYETATRAGAGANLNSRMHPHGVWGVLGGAAALAVFDGAPAEDIDETLRVAASLALATSRPTMLEGATVRNAYAGFAGQHAVMARRLVRAGFTGDARALDVVFGQVIGSDWRGEALAEGLGDSWAIERGYFKRHACCRFNHASLDALADIRAERPFKADEVAGVAVDAYALAVELDDPSPGNMLAAKFSLPFALATSIRREGDTWLDAFRGDALRDPATLDLAARVKLTVDPAFEALAPIERHARVHVTLKSGETLVAERANADGDPERPFPEALLDDKIDRLLTPSLGIEAAAVRSALLDIRAAAEIGPILALLTLQGTRA